MRNRNLQALTERHPNARGNSKRVRPARIFYHRPALDSIHATRRSNGHINRDSALVIMCLAYPYEDSDPNYEFRGVLACAIVGIGGGLVFVIDIIALVMFWDGVLHPALTAHGVNCNSARILSDLIALITNTAAFAAPIAACVEIFRALERREDRKKTRRKYLEARALERATRD